MYRIAEMVNRSFIMNIILIFRFIIRFVIRIPIITPRGREAFSTPWMKCLSGLFIQLFANETEF